MTSDVVKDDHLRQNVDFIQPTIDLQARARETFLKSGIKLSLFPLILFFILDYRSQYYLAALADGLITSVFIAVLIASYRVKDYSGLYNIVIGVMVTSVSMRFYSPAAIRSVFIMPVIALAAYLLLSRVGGVAWSIMMCGIAFVEVMLDKYGFFQMSTDYHFVIYGIMGTAILSALLFIYEGTSLSVENQAICKGSQLVVANRRLDQQANRNSHASEELKQALEESQASNKKLVETKRAIMNILEDSKSLQAQLKAEKAGVEKIVEVRTEELYREQTRLRASINSLDSGYLMTLENSQSVVYNPALVKLLDLGDSVPGMKHVKSDDMVKLIQSKLGDSFDIVGALKDSIKNKNPFSAVNIAYGKKFINIFSSPIVLKGEEDAIGNVVMIYDTTEAMLLERSKDEFISIASHELRTPLTVIRGNASMLTSIYGDQLPEGDIKDMINDIKDSSIRLIGIVNQFLSTSRLEQKRTIFDIKPTDIATTILSAATALKVLADEKKLELKINLPKDLPLVYTDESRTQEVVVNIVGNAIKYTKKGSVTVTAHVIKGFVKVDVADTGIGIDEENIKLLFNKFQQSTSNILTRDDSQSTGLGLYITKLIIEQMGGRIYLKESTLGKGSVFTFALPTEKIKL